MNFVRITDENKLLEILSYPLKNVALDCEATDKNPRTASLISVVLSMDGETAYSIPARFISLLTPLIHAEKLYLQNFKYDFHLLFLHGLDLSNTKYLDVMLLHHLLDENADHDLNSIVKGEFQDDYKERFWSRFKSFEEADGQSALEYECKDAIYTFRLCERFIERLSDRGNLVSHVHRLSRSLYFTEVRGLRVDTELMQSTQREMGSRIATYLPKLRDEFSEACEAWELEAWHKELLKRKTPKGRLGVPRPTFNFGSNKQIQWLLYNHLDLPVLKTTKAKAPATDYETIEKLSETHPILKTYKYYIDIKTIFGTFVEGLIERVDDARIYPSFNINGTVTGRISHSNPNMGNMPKDGPYRNFFLPDPGHSIIGADYSQLEVVIEANLTGDANLAKIVLGGASKHDITNDEMRLNDRELAKTLNFAMGYHCGAYKLSKLMKCSMSEAEYQWNRYWEVYSGCRALKIATDKEVDTYKQVRNIVGRVRHFPDKFETQWEREAAYRQAYNFKIQGPGADFTNQAFYEFSEWIENYSIGRALFSVHDEIVASVENSDAEYSIEQLTGIMVDIGVKHGLKIPLSAKGYGPFARWQKA